MPFTLHSHPRFEIRHRIGHGASGSVFAAWDRTRGEVVALKALHHREPGAVYRFKQEFRLLAEVVHPNLVSLYELFAEGDHLFFTMELVDGEDFLSWVRLTDPEEATLTATPRVNSARLYAALRQITIGLRALHGTDRIHCDLKPTNVLVTPHGRVVILDFGVGRFFGAGVTEESVQEGLFGTIHYMAPEQAQGESLLPASDWYALGVMLYQALTGRLPYSGNAVQILYEKTHRAARSPGELMTDLPADIVDLCCELLSIDPAARPDGAEIEARLTGVDASAEPATDSDTEAGKPALIGRSRELEILQAALQACRDGEGRSFWIHGESGMGKTSFLQAAVQIFRRQENAVILLGRCLDRELMPYKAFDGVLDNLTRFLRTLPAQEAEIYLPRGLRALTRIFPVLLRVEPIARAVEGRPDSPDRRAERRRAFAALREFFERLAHRRLLILHIDDLQWADTDSMSLLGELLRPPDPPPFLLVATFRSEEIARHDFLRELIATADGERRSVLELTPLADEDAAQLAREMLGADTPQAWVERIVREAHGSPFLIEHLVGFVRDLEPGSAGLDFAMTLATTLEARLARLPAGCGELLEMLAVAGRPIDAANAMRATDQGGDLQSRITALRAARLVSLRGGGRIELYHDRIRAVLLARMSQGEREALQEWLGEVSADRKS